MVKNHCSGCTTTSITLLTASVTYKKGNVHELLLELKECILELQLHIS